jgi:preprotein translocase subunit YajC
MITPMELWAELLPLAAAAKKGTGDTPSKWTPLLMVGAVFVLMYILMIHPQRKRQRQRVRMLEALRKGDKVLTRGGIYGTITNVRNDNRIVVKVDDNVKLTLNKAGIARVVTPESEDAQVS